MGLDAEKLILSVYKFFSREHAKKKLEVAMHRVFVRTITALGIKKAFLCRLLKKNRAEDSASAGTASNETSGETSGSVSKAGMPDSFDRDVIKRCTLSLLSQNKNITLKALRERVIEAGINISKFALWKTLHRLGFCYGKPDKQSKEVLMERPDLTRKRATYLRKIREYRQQKRPIVYLDETWVDTHCYPAKQWMAPSGHNSRKLPSNRGQRFVILHCGGEDTGFLENCDLVFLSKSKDGRDYHSEMNNRIFMDWVRNQLSPALHQPSVVVMDNASYHSVQVQEAKAPTSATRKQEMKLWLQSKNIAVDERLTKPKLYELIKQHKEQASLTYTVDSFLQSQGHEVLRLPPYHCELNPIELIWGDLKQFVALNNNTFKQADVRELIDGGIQNIDQSRWCNACNHVVKLEEEWLRRDNIQADRISPVIISISETDSEDEDEEGDTDSCLK